MAVLMRQDVPGMSADQFATSFGPVMESIKAFPGFVANATGPVAGGYRVTEVWESQEAHERWVREVIAPIMQQANWDKPLPAAEYVTLDRFFTR